MKVINWITILTLLTISADSQITYQKLDTKKSKINLDLNTIGLNYSPSNIIIEIGFAQKELEDGKQAIEFAFITGRMAKPAIIKPDSILLKSTTDRSILFNKPYSDSIYYLNDGELSQHIIHYIEKSKLSFLETERIEKIIVIIDNSPLEIKLSKKSQTLFREAFSTKEDN
jgi:hypothetical protein